MTKSRSLSRGSIVPTEPLRFAAGVLLPISDQPIHPRVGATRSHLDCGCGTSFEGGADCLCRSSNSSTMEVRGPRAKAIVSRGPNGRAKTQTLMMPNWRNNSLLYPRARRNVAPAPRFNIQCSSCHIYVFITFAVDASVTDCDPSDNSALTSALSFFRRSIRFYWRNVPIPCESDPGRYGCRLTVVPRFVIMGGRTPGGIPLPPNKVRLIIGCGDPINEESPLKRIQDNSSPDGRVYGQTEDGDNQGSGTVPGTNDDITDTLFTASVADADHTPIGDLLPYPHDAFQHQTDETLSTDANGNYSAFVASVINHEIGHLLGLDHPNEDSSGKEIPIPDGYEGNIMLSGQHFISSLRPEQALAISKYVLENARTINGQPPSAWKGPLCPEVPCCESSGISSPPRLGGATERDTRSSGAETQPSGGGTTRRSGK